MQNGFVMNGWRNIVAVIDKAVLNLIVSLYELIKTIAEQQIFSNETIDAFATRVYTFLALIMIFKVTFSLITYLVNPESINDKTNGAGNMAKNVIITLVLIIMVPYGFDFLYRAQAAMLKDNIVGKVILGTADDLSSTSLVMDPACGEIGADTTIHSNPDTMGQYLAMVTIRPFYQIYREAGKEDMKVADMNVDELRKYCSASNVNELMSPEIYNGHSGGNWIFKGKYYIDYSTILSTVVCFVVMLLMLTTCLDIAVRTIKLGFLEVIAPIPIISYVDPKSGKDGIFKKWLNNVIGTWALLFIKLATVYFALYVITLVGEAVERTKGQGIWVMLFLTIGALMFAKQAPKLIEDIFGIKIDGMGLHPIKKLKEEAPLLTSALKGTGKVLGMGAAGYMSIAGSIAKGKNYRETLNGMEQKFNDNKSARDAIATKKIRDLMDQRMAHKITPQEFLEGYKNIRKEQHDSNIAEQAEIDKYKNQFSHKRPILAGTIAAAQSIGGVMSVDPKSIRDIISAANDATVRAAKARSYRDSYGFGDRVMDKVTNWGDVKYKGGTADKIDNTIKELNDQLNRVKNALDGLRVERSAFQPGAFSYDTTTGSISVPSSYTGSDREIAERNVRQTKELEETIVTLTKEIKKQTNIKEQRDNASKK